MDRVVASGMIKLMNSFQKLTHGVDRFQQKYPVFGFPIAVVKRYSEDQIGRQAALITYYGFLALFPLILAFITIIGIIVQNDPDLQAKIYSQLFQHFPALGEDLARSFHSLKSSGIPLIIELLVLIYGARGVVVSLQEAFNRVWHTQKDVSSNFFLDNMRNLAMIMAVGVGMTATTVASYWLTTVLRVNLATTIFVGIINLLFAILLFLVVFRLGTSGNIRLKNLGVGAVIAAVGLIIVQHFGAYIMGQELPKLRGAYGSFALTLGMMFWIYLQAQIIMYSLVTTAVRTQHDWPKKLL
jgi:membrane protein